jgi:hypothetical protein
MPKDGHARDERWHVTAHVHSIGDRDAPRGLGEDEADRICAVSDGCSHGIGAR